MAVYYKFKSAKDYDSVPIDGHFITVATLKEKIYESKQLGRGTDFDLVITNAQTNEEYLDEATLIPKNTSVLIRRVPGQPRKPIVAGPVIDQAEPKVENVIENFQPANSSFMGAEPSVLNYPDTEYDEFGNDLYEIPEVVPVVSSKQVMEATPTNKIDEDSKLRALIDTPALDWQRQTSDNFGPGNGFGPGRGFGRGMGGRMGARGFGRGGFERKTPPEGYVCHRCKTPGHFIQHCPTNGDPNFDVRRAKPPTGIPKSMLVATPDGSYALPSGAVAVLKPNEAAFEKEIEGMPSTRPVGDLPPELYCPLCKQVMKDAVLTSKCCFQSFCDKCIRDHIISKSMCSCGATNILADDLLPNKTLRDTISRILESNNNSSGDNGGSAVQVQDMESKIPQPKAPSPASSAASKGEKVTLLKEENTKVQGFECPQTVSAPQQALEKDRAAKVPDVSEATHESRSVKEQPGLQGVGEEEVQQKPVPSEGAKKKKKKKAQLGLGGADMQWRSSQDFGADSYMMPPGPNPFNPYWNGMQPGMEAFLGPYGGPMPYMGYGLGPMDVPFGGVMPPMDPFGVPGFMMPPLGPPQRDLADFGMGFTGGPPMSREEFEARKAEAKWNRERRGGRELSRDRDFGREASSNGDPSLKSKSKLPPSSSNDHHHQKSHRHRSERTLSPERHSRDSPDPPRASSKRRSENYDDYDDTHHRQHRHHHHSHRHSESSAPKEPPPAESKPPLAPPTSSTHKPSVFSRISFPEKEKEADGGAAASSKKRRLTSSTSEKAVSNGYHDDHHKVSSRKSTHAAADVEVDYESSDEERHFKRRSTKDRERDRVREDRDRVGHSKHR